MKLGLVSCSKSKQDYQCRAEEMYLPSDLFAKAYEYSKRNYDEVAILSAKYGLILPDEIIDPYDLTLKTMRKREKLDWAERVFKQLDEKIGLQRINLVAFHAGIEYREHFIQKLREARIACCVPLERLSFGQQLAWYNEHMLD